MGEQPYYFQIIPRAIISKTFDQQSGQFRFHIYKVSQRMDTSKDSLVAKFVQNRMKVQNVKLNFFLPNYFSGKNSSAKFTFQLSKKSKNYEQKVVGSYVFDANIYVEQFKRSNNNHLAQLWNVSESYSVQIEIFFDQSRYLLEKLLKQYKDVRSQSFQKPLQGQNLGLSKKSELEEEEYDNQDRYKQKRIALLNQYGGAIVGQGGYKFLADQSQKQKKKIEQQRKKQKSLVQSRAQKTKGSKKNQQQMFELKKTQSKMIQPEVVDSQSQLKSLKYIILAIIVLILLGSGYFISKMFLKEQSGSQIVQQPNLKIKKGKDDFSKKGKSGKSKKSKKPQQL